MLKSKVEEVRARSGELKDMATNLPARMARWPRVEVGRLFRRQAAGSCAGVLPADQSNVLRPGTCANARSAVMRVQPSATA